MADKVTGVVDRIVENGKRTALKIDDAWYSTFDGVNGTVEGALVEVEYETVVKGDKAYHNIQTIETLAEPAESPTVGTEDGEPSPFSSIPEPERIARSVALKAAVAWSTVWKDVDDGVREPETVVKVAETFFEFLRGGHLNGEVPY